jgi:hypothetical protein
VPLCRAHHCEIHRCGDEGSWWENTGIDPLAAARTLWRETHPLPRSEVTTTNGPRPTRGPMTSRSMHRERPTAYKSQTKTNRSNSQA